MLQGDTDASASPTSLFHDNDRLTADCSWIILIIILSTTNPRVTFPNPRSNTKPNTNKTMFNSQRLLLAELYNTSRPRPKVGQSTTANILTFNMLGHWILYRVALWCAKHAVRERTVLSLCSLKPSILLLVNMPCKIQGPQNAEHRQYRYLHTPADHTVECP